MIIKEFQSVLTRERLEKPVIRLLMLWAGISLIMISLIKTVIRPGHFYFSGTYDFLLGTLPNFFAGAVIFVFGFIFYRPVFIENHSVFRRFLFSFLFSFCSLSAWEIIQYFMGYPIDYFDILMTVAGNITTIALAIIPGIKYFDH
jgi:hypothetical protein